MFAYEGKAVVCDFVERVHLFSPRFVSVLLYLTASGSESLAFIDILL